MLYAMGTIKDIKDLNSALDFFAGYAPLEGTVPVDYKVQLLHAGDILLSEALQFARQKITGHLQVTHIVSIPAQHRAAAVLWFVQTLARRKGEELGRIYNSLLTYPPEVLAEKFASPGHITEWVQMSAVPFAPATPEVVEPARAGEVLSEVTLNRFGIVEGDGVVIVKRFGARLSPDEALHLSSDLQQALINLAAAKEKLEAARAAVRKASETPEQPQPA